MPSWEVDKFESVSFDLFHLFRFSQGFNLSPESSCQLGWCMAKLGKKPASEELFAMVIK